MAIKQPSFVIRFETGTLIKDAMNAVQAEIKRRAWKAGKVQVRLHMYGDPDGAGDLQRTKQYALELTKQKVV